MKCQKCKMNEATAHIKKIVNGKKTEMYLCADCANEENMDYGSVFTDMQGEFEKMLGSFFGNVLPARTGASHCKTCGSTYAEISQTGRVGCADCYSEFYESLLPSIRRIHGNTTHCGKRARSFEAAAVPKQNDLEAMKRELEEAVQAQNFERAAELRDKINEIKKGESGSEL